jgi:hypothetical protein
LSPFASSEVPPAVHDVLKSPGEPLDGSTRQLMEGRFHHNFANVRVHSDDGAAESARSIHALAYTLGDHIAFAKGRYAPATATGARLLAHELAHVVQQTGGMRAKVEIGAPGDACEHEADRVADDVAGGRQVLSLKAGSASGVLQRTPAPPVWQGVTGVRDLSKLTIDAIPDFERSKLTAARDIHAHVKDPAVTHLTWELYDTADQSVTGFSTLPGSPNSTTAPFSLDPALFSSSFSPGKYILRCTGLNAQNQPIVYADRDFYVLSGDLTTGTPLATTYGTLTFTKYSKTDATPPANPRYSVDVELRFLPDKSVTCGDVAFMQSMRTIDNNGNSQQNTVNAEQDARKTPLAWSIDARAGDPSPFYIVGRDPAGKAKDIPGLGQAGHGGKAPTFASLIDKPSWNRENVVTFESCTICRSGHDRGKVFGCATWGYTATSAGAVTLMPRSFRQMPSEQFAEARNAWDTWRATRPAATRPEEAPPLSKP